MIVNSTELQNNFGKYLMMSMQKEVIITRNGVPVAKLTSLTERAPEQDGARELIKDEAPEPAKVDARERIMEGAESYGYTGRKATFEEFLRLTENTEDRYEYIDGEIYLLSSPRTMHQTALAELFVHFYNWFQGKKCTPMVAPYDIELRRTPDNINMVQPDIMIICDLQEHLNDNDYYKGVPSLLVEILSISTRSKDLIKKLDLYMSCGVREYWIVDPLNKEITVYLFEDHDIRDMKTYKNNEIVHSFYFEGLTAELQRIFK